jgi:hypothetical protein
VLNFPGLFYKPERNIVKEKNAEKNGMRSRRPAAPDIEAAKACGPAPEKA